MAPHPLLPKCSLTPLYLLLWLACAAALLLLLLLGPAHARPLPAPRFPLCKLTPYPSLCSHILSTLPSNAPLNRQIAAVSEYALTLTESTRGIVAKETGSPSKGKRSAALTTSAASAQRKPSKLAEEALQDCMDLMGNSVDQLKQSIGKVSSLNLGSRSTMKSARGQVMDAQVSLSASLTFQGTCQDEVSQQARAIPGPAAAVLLRQSNAISQALAVGLSLAASLQKSLHA